ncbi:MAG: putative manganese transporter [Methanocellales archaeon]|nr:putative manganese transporter [Methanocellales archaeon]MDD3291243.1 putative manganese transporter [Methanocellales archaeon]MDD5235415.1 putative manganese transporter [Methanocellales archaeon]MDD5484502.1 putative manganese transporter [Methanocellales archaeon]
MKIIIQELLSETLKILLMVFALMVLVEYLELRFKDKIREVLTKKPLSQYVGSSFLGATPGCVGTFFIVSLYVHGMISFGALVAVMVATAGDEAFVMLAMMPRTALLIFAICLLLGVIAGFLADGIAKKIKLKTSQPCEIEIHEEERQDIKHFLEEHVCNHILKKHMPKLFLWLFFTMLAIELLMLRFDLGAILPKNMLFLILLAALIGILPSSGPHLIFFLLFAKGLIPFSVLLVNSIVQDGHGLLPLLSYTIKDTIYVKVFNVAFGLVVGLILILMGV